MQKFTLSALAKLSYAESLNHLMAMEEHFKQAHTYQSEYGLTEFTNLSHFDKEVGYILDQYTKVILTHPKPILTEEEFNYFHQFVDNYQNKSIKSSLLIGPLFSLFHTMPTEKVKEFVKKYANYIPLTVSNLRKMSPTVLFYLLTVLFNKTHYGRDCVDYAVHYRKYSVPRFKGNMPVMECILELLSGVSVDDGSITPDSVELVFGGIIQQLIADDFELLVRLRHSTHLKSFMDKVLSQPCFDDAEFKYQEWRTISTKQVLLMVNEILAAECDEPYTAIGNVLYDAEVSQNLDYALIGSGNRPEFKAIVHRVDGFVSRFGQFERVKTDFNRYVCECVKLDKDSLFTSDFKDIVNFNKDYLEKDTVIALFNAISTHFGDLLNYELNDNEQLDRLLEKLKEEDNWYLRYFFDSYTKLAEMFEIALPDDFVRLVALYQEVIPNFDRLRAEEANRIENEKREKRAYLEKNRNEHRKAFTKFKTELMNAVEVEFHKFEWQN